ncbi:hypothetical protein N7457_004567 [Penicillium paradoxum]|uniref:uncharacterized protein n=1 Tax=Penicillium paradoxum TaxID=176176 RepID=UPI00254719E4|nr:uncharacterized protein N7457_004567 [Penicillium paradoxum]KAJ5782793.1 hypothetical protein N7457_004567 [Penicillium paradoxum]
MRSSIVFLSALATSVMGANSTAYTLPADFNLALVEAGERSAWCSAQRNTCPDICQKGTKLNSCDPNTLIFSCVCSDDSTPDVSPYKQTVPFYVCQANFGQCINSHPNDAEGQRACKKSAVCGSKNASAETTTSSTTTSASTTTLATATATESSASATSSVAAASTTTNAAVALGDLTQYSTGLMAGLMFVAARMIL